MKAVKETVRNYYKYDYSNPIYGGTVVGSLTNNNGIVSGFTANDYIDASPFPEWNTLELVVKFKVNSLSKKITLVGSPNSTTMYRSPWIAITTAGAIRFLYATNSGISAPDTVQTGNWYWVKLTYDGTNEIIYSSTNGTTWNEGGSRSTTNTFVGGNWYIGNGTDGSSGNPKFPLDGEIDLNETYVKLKGVYWYKGVTYPIIAGTSSDYDFYEDVDIYKAPLITEKYVEETWINPTLTNNTSYGTITSSNNSDTAYMLFNGEQTNIAFNSGEVSYVWELPEKVIFNQAQYRPVSTITPVVYGVTSFSIDIFKNGMWVNVYTQNSPQATLYTVNIEPILTNKVKVRITPYSGWYNPSGVADVAFFGVKRVRVENNTIQNYIEESIYKGFN